MASAAPPNRMVSSVFITLASPYRATVTQQQQPALQAHSAPARDMQHTAVRVSPSDSVPVLRHRKEEVLSSPESHGRVEKGRVHTGALAQASDPQSPKHAQPGRSRGLLQEDDRGAEGIFGNKYVYFSLKSWIQCLIVNWTKLRLP